MPCENYSAVRGEGVLISLLLSGKVCVRVCVPASKLASVAVSSHEQHSTCMYELILRCLQQLLAPLRPRRPCRTGSLCCTSNPFLTLPLGKRQRGLMEQFHAIVMRNERC